MKHMAVATIVGLLLLPARAGAERAQGRAGSAVTDQTVPLAGGGRVELGACAGGLVVRTWNRDEVRVHAAHEPDVDVRITARDQVVAIRTQSGRRIAVDYELTVPAAVTLHAQGLMCTADIAGVRGTVQIETVEGDVRLSGNDGHAIATTVEGQITVDGGDARLQLSTVEGTVRITDAGGDISAQSVDGDIVLTGVNGPAIEVSTVDGDVTFSGTFQPGGRYQFTTHDGDVVLAIPGNSSAILGIRTFDGELDSALELTLTSESGRGRRRQVFTLGSGSAQVEVETFDGDVRIRRAE